MKITIRYGNKTQLLHSDSPVRADLLLSRSPFPFAAPCGSGGICGKCRVWAKGDITPPDAAECRLLGYEALHSGMRLACRLTVCGDAELILPSEDRSSSSFLQKPKRGSEYDLALDLGTTTIEARALIPGTAQVFWSGVAENRQRRYGADVVTRLSYAQKNGTTALETALFESISELLRPLSPYKIRKAVYTGNTVMLHFSAGLPVDGFYSAPFSAQSLFGNTQKGTTYPRCIDAFLGADLCCSIIACEMTKQKNTLLLDLGTNCEMAFWDGAQMLCASVPAGPAFEGENIRCGMRAHSGAIDRVFWQNGAITYTVIGGGTAHGLCASGLIDLIAALRKENILTENGYLKEPYRLTENVVLFPEDVRAFQVAKAAVAAGMRVLLGDTNKLNALFLGGNFGSNLPMQSAAALGLLPENLLKKTILSGNTALCGAILMLTQPDAEKSEQEIADAAKSVSLAGNSAFETEFLQNMALRPFSLPF